MQLNWSYQSRRLHIRSIKNEANLKEPLNFFGCKKSRFKRRSMIESGNQKNRLSIFIFLMFFFWFLILKLACWSIFYIDLIFSSGLSTGIWIYSTDKGSRERAIGPGGEASAGINWPFLYTMSKSYIPILSSSLFNVLWWIDFLMTIGLWSVYRTNFFP